MPKVGTIYSYPDNSRAFKALIAAKYNGDTVDYPAFQMGVTNKTPEVKKKFPLGKVPAFEAVDGFTLYESSAIAYYVASLKKDSPLLGKDAKEAATIQQYICVADNEVSPNVSGWLYPTLGFIPYNKAQVDQAIKFLTNVLNSLESVLLTRTYFVGERVTLADICLAMTLYSVYRSLFDAERRKQFPNLTRWFVTIINQPNVKAVVGDFKLCTEALKFDPNRKVNVAPAKPEGKKQEKKEKPKKEKKEDLEAVAAAEEKAKSKEKNPLDLLPPSPFIMDEWKRFYSNNEEPASCKWFWEHFDPEGYSMWRVSYKYNDELTMTFMSSNLVGGFFQRIERARKYAFGSLCILGENNSNEILGYFIVRGQDVPFEISDAADYESYSWTKVDPKDEKARKLFNACISWDKEIEGKKFADGKIFK